MQGAESHQRTRFWKETEAESRARGEGSGGATGARAAGRAVPYLAVEPGVAVSAGALVRAVRVLAGAPVQTGPRVTLIDVMLAVAAHQACWAQAGESVDAIHARATIEAGAASARKSVTVCASRFIHGDSSRARAPPHLGLSNRATRQGRQSITEPNRHMMGILNQPQTLRMTILHAEC